MPAHRSQDEADIRTDVVAFLREHVPQARIIHEINASGQGSNRIDVLAVAPERIVAVEIKSKKDKLDRLPDQLKAMRGVAHHSVAALHEKFLIKSKANEWSAHWTDDEGTHWRNMLPEWLMFSRAETWVWPRRSRAADQSYDHLSRWDWPREVRQTSLPQGALDMLWAAELRWLCHRLMLGVGARTTMPECKRLLRWNCTGKELTRGICAALRRRDCIEADPIVTDALPSELPLDGAGGG